MSYIAAPDLPGDPRPTGPTSTAEAIGGLVNGSAEGTPDARLQRPRHSNRGAGGRFAKASLGGYDPATRCHVARDWSQGPGVSEGFAAQFGHPCVGDSRCGICYPAAFWNELQEQGL